MRATYTVEVTVERESGKFASRDDIMEQVREALEQADPGEVTGGADGDSVYTVTDWSVTEQ